MSAPAPTSPLTVLIVDDDDVFRSTLAERLAASGYGTAVARDGMEAVRQARALEPHVILLDMRMPDMTGWEALPALRRLPLKRRPRIIALSGNDDAASRQRAFECGCDEYIVKAGGSEAVLGALSAARQMGLGAPDRAGRYDG